MGKAIKDKRKSRTSGPNGGNGATRNPPPSVSLFLLVPFQYRVDSIQIKKVAWVSTLSY